MFWLNTLEKQYTDVRIATSSGSVRQGAKT